MATGTQSNGRMTGASKYTPVDYNPSEIMPDAAPGIYTAVIERVICKPHKESGYPQITIGHKIESEDAGITDNEQFLGSEVAKFITLFPDTERRSRMGKLDIQELFDATGLDINAWPARIENPDEDLKEIFEALKGQRLKIWVSNREGQPGDDGQPRIFQNVMYKEPKNFAQLIGLEVAEEPAEERPAPRTASRTPAKKAPAKKSASARR